MSRVKTQQTTNTSQPTYKRTGMPLYGENVLNFLMKVILGAFVFWILYYQVYDPDMEFLTQMSYIMLFSLLASLTALLLSYILIQIITNLLRRPKKGLFDLNSFPDMGIILYELWAVFLNALFVASGIMIFLDKQSASWEQFFLLFLIMKIITRVLAYCIAVIFNKNIILTIGFCVVFFAIMTIAILQIAGEYL